ncbi:CDP-glycerol glycerophosphotransferase family protein [Polaribacter sp. P097]|uniref:CDP-glycerol glycerophosphotransferase family protein n=1 Tax=Polaribacter sp. P097 TaxID=3117398 RepID=UPI002FDF319D
MIKNKLRGYLVNLLKRIITNKRKIVYHSFPDFTDNSFATFVFVSNNLPKYKNIWLVDSLEKKDFFLKLIANYTASENYIILKKKSVKGFFHYLTAELVFHTHGLFNELGLIKGQRKINLWHGMPIKKIGLYEGSESKIPISNIHLSTSQFYQKILMKAFGSKINQVQIVGQTRNDLLLNDNISIHRLFNDRENYAKTILWMPTFRKSVVRDLRTDGSIEKEKDFINPEYLKKLNSFLKESNSIVYVKLHPMDYRGLEDFINYTNIKFLNNNSFIEKGVNMYSTFSSFDILLTDFSSIYIDFLLLDIPIGFVFSDLQEFKESRGFVFEDPIKYMPGEIISNEKELELFLSETILKEKDSYIEQRSQMKNLFHKYHKNFNEQLFNNLSKFEY